MYNYIVVEPSAMIYMGKDKYESNFCLFVCVFIDFLEFR